MNRALLDFPNFIKGYKALSHGFVEALIKKEDKHQVNVSAGKL